MRYFIFLLLCGLSITAFGQGGTDGKNSGTLNIKADTNNQVNLSPESTFKISGGNEDSPMLNVGEEEGISMLPKEQFLTNSGDKAVNKANKSLTEGNMDLSQFKRDQYLGDVKSNAKKLKLVCRDYQYVDGDRIKIVVNDSVVNYNLLLEGSYKGIEIDLPSGFNKIDFIALNMGTSFPNTAELLVYDDNGELLSSTQWNLYTGFKASIVVVKE